jgi:hypothetical protein
MRPARPLTAALADSPAAVLLHRLERWRSIAATIGPAAAAISPEFPSGDPRACELKDDLLVLNAGSAAQAAKLRQGLPQLLRLLHQRGAQVTEIRVRVQPAVTGRLIDGNDPSSVTPQPAQVRDPLPAGARDGARHLADHLVKTLPAGPLRDQALRLQQSLRRPGQAP